MADPVGTVELLAQDPTTLGREDVLAGLSSAEELRSWIAAREGRFARRLDELPKDPSDPAKDLAGTLERNQNVGRGEAKRRKDRAEQLERLPETEEKLEQGEITDGHADAMARAKADAQAQAALEANEARLLEEGRKESPREFAKRLDRFVQRHSADDGRSEWDKKKARQRLSLGQDAEGMTQLRGEYAPEDGQTVSRVLHGVSEELFRRDHQDHPADEPVPFLERSSEQRLAEALVEICRRAEGARGPAKNDDRAVVLLAYDDLVDNHGPDSDSSTLADGTPVPASVARRIACDAGLIPAVLNGKGCVLDLGRSQRVASPSQRLALKLMWQSCSFAECRSPFDWCQIHHTIPFNDDGGHGRTDLGELTPLCRHCHDLAHTRGLDLHQEPRRSLDHHDRPRRHPLAPAPRPAPNNRAAPSGGDRNPGQPGTGRHPLHPRRLTRTAQSPRASSSSGITMSQRSMQSAQR